VAAAIQVLVAEMPPLLRDIVVNVVSKQTDMKLMSPEPRHGGSRRMRAAAPDVVVLAAAGADGSRAAEWLGRWPHARVIVVETNARQSVVYELRPHATFMGELSPQQLVETIRRAAHGHLADDQALRERHS
jgi:DNA-binding NarL/FixJ family response regulator